MKRTVFSRLSPDPARALAALTALALLAGCSANGDFGEVRPTLVRDDMHDWIGADAVAGNAFQLTDDERALRDLAYPLIEPPYDRHRWYSIAGEYGAFGYDRRSGFDRTAYAKHLLSEHFRSPAARYAQLTDDIRNDGTRLPQFFETAGGVIDMDRKRRKSLAYVSALTRSEHDKTLRRVDENARIVAMVRTSLMQRASAYRFALERLVIASPSVLAVDAERAVNRLQVEIERYGTSLPPTWTREPSLAAAD